MGEFRVSILNCIKGGKISVSEEYQSIEKKLYEGSENSGMRGGGKDVGRLAGWGSNERMGLGK